MSAKKIKAVIMNVPERELMADIFMQENGEAILPVHVNVLKLKRSDSDIYFVAEDRDKTVKRRQLANAKERLRVRSLNAMFALLKRIVPVMPLGRKPSKVDMLRAAAEYIRLLSAVLQDSCSRESPSNVLQSGDAQPNTGNSLQTDVWTIDKVLLAPIPSTVPNEAVCTPAPAPTPVAPAAIHVNDPQPRGLLIQCVQPPFQYILQLAPGVDQDTLQPSCSTPQPELTAQFQPQLQLPFQIQAQTL